MSVQAIALTDAALGRTRQQHGFRDDKSNHPCCTLCDTRAMQSKQQMRMHEGGNRHQENYDEYLRVIRNEEHKRNRLAYLNPQYDRVQRMVAIKCFSNGDVIGLPMTEIGTQEHNPFWVGDLRNVKTAAYDWICASHLEDEHLFNLFRAAWQKHVDRVRMDVLLLAFVSEVGPLNAAWRDVASCILPHVAVEDAAWRHVTELLTDKLVLSDPV
jgi:hypothetical protein